MRAKFLKIMDDIGSILIYVYIQLYSSDVNANESPSAFIKNYTKNTSALEKIISQEGIRKKMAKPRHLTACANFVCHACAA